MITPLPACKKITRWVRKHIYTPHSRLYFICPNLNVFQGSSLLLLKMFDSESWKQFQPSGSEKTSILPKTFKPQIVLTHPATTIKTVLLYMQINVSVNCQWCHLWIYSVEGQVLALHANCRSLDVSIWTYNDNITYSNKFGNIILNAMHLLCFAIYIHFSLRGSIEGFPITVDYIVRDQLKFYANIFFMFLKNACLVYHPICNTNILI